MPFVFTAPWLLLGLLTLPVIWWLLRATPPKPAQEIFPPLRILAQLIKSDEEPSKSPWWLTLLRLVLAGLIILALAGPIWKPQPVSVTGADPVVIIIDNGWASAPLWSLRQRNAAHLLDNAQSNNAPIYLLATAEEPNQQIGPFTAQQAQERLQALAPRPTPVDRQHSFQRLGETLPADASSRIFYLSDGIAAKDDEAAFQFLDKAAASLQLFTPDLQPIQAITGIENRNDALMVNLLRPDTILQAETIQLNAYDNKGRQIATTSADFAPDQHDSRAKLTIPVQLRNDIAQIKINNSNTAAATWLLDDLNKRRRVALLTNSNVASENSLLSPLHYISTAIAPFADIISANAPDISQSIDTLLEQKPSILILPDIGHLPDGATTKLLQWIRDGGTLLRFAGPKLSNAQNLNVQGNGFSAQRDPLLPVVLRAGQRNLGGTLSWSTPQHLAEPPADSPFKGLKLPQDVTVSRQVLAEPTPDLLQKSWLNLSDGTPLITGEVRGSGRLILFHIAPDISWSNLPLSGGFVDLLRRITELSTSFSGANSSGEQASLPAYRLLDAQGNLTGIPSSAKPLLIQKDIKPQVTMHNPPGLYGNEEAFVALNLLEQNSRLVPLELPQLSKPVTQTGYITEQSVNLQGPFFAIAALLLALDGLLPLWLTGTLNRIRIPRRSGAKHARFLLLILGPPLLAIGFVVFSPSGLVTKAQAQTQTEAQNEKVLDDSKPDDQAKIDVLDVTHLGFILTGDQSVDEVSRIGLTGLNQFIADKTALEPGPSIGLDPEKDELAFYPLIYWPVDAGAPFPSDKALQRIDAYMAQGGTVIFDTRDQLTNEAGSLQGTSPATQRLREMLDNMNIPPLAPIADQHVLTKTFYIMPDFPGRYRGSPLWGEAPNDTQNSDQQSADRPVRNGDGVSPILITGNDLAGAWAMDENWQPLYPTIPNDPLQRIYALRGGVNIVMYVLTGNYKADQVHVPALLERLGN